MDELSGKYPRADLVIGFKADATSLGNALAKSGLKARKDFLSAMPPLTLAGIAHLFRFIL
jgi:hypothetical protein